MKKAFVAALAIAALAVIAGASAAPKPSMKHLMIGFDHTPTAADTAFVEGLGGTVRYTFKSINVLAVDIPADKANNAKQGAGVSYVEDDPVRTPLSFSSTLPTSQLVPSLDNGLYGLVTTHAVEAQAAGYRGTNVKACVADTGLDTRHPDIAPNFLGGYDAFDPSKPTVDVNDLGVAETETHATHVSGIVLGADNGLGILGVAPQAKLLEARVLGTQPDGSVSGETSQVMDGVAWLAAHGCKVINMSLGGGDRSQSEEALYNDIIQHGTTIVVASGNDSARQLSFPGRYQNVISVGAVDSDNNLASFSNTGAQLDLVGPGVNNLSSFPHLQGRDAYLTVGSTTYEGNPAEFSPATDGITGPIVDCGKALAVGDCGTHSGTWVALVQRGGDTFANKVTHAKADGASAVVLYNNVAGPLNPTLGAASPDWIPTIALSKADGDALAASLTPTTTGTAFNVATDWNLDSGTSMATPHVTGVVALILGKNPNLNPHQIEMILDKTATDLGVPNYDTTYGYGLVNAEAALAATPNP